MVSAFVFNGTVHEWGHDDEYGRAFAEGSWLETCPELVEGFVDGWCGRWSADRETDKRMEGRRAGESAYPLESSAGQFGHAPWLPPLFSTIPSTNGVTNTRIEGAQVRLFVIGIRGWLVWRMTSG